MIADPLREEKELEAIFREHSSAYKNLAIYLLGFLVMSANMNPFIHITEPTERALSVTKGNIIMVGLVLGIVTFIITFFLPYFLLRYNLRRVIIFAGLFAFVGSLVRLYVLQSFICALVASAIIGVPIAVLMGIQMLFVQTWFAQATYKKVYPVIKVTQFMGGAIFALAPFLFINEFERNIEVLRDEFSSYMRFIFCLSLGFFIIAAIFTNATPPKGFGEIDAKPPTREFNAFLGDCRRALKNLKFRSYMWPFVMTRTALLLFSMNCNLFFEEIGSRQWYGSLTFMFAMFVGIPGAYIFDLLFSDKPKRGLIVFQILSAAVFIGMVFTLHYKLEKWLIITYMAAGFLSINQAAVTFRLMQTNNLQLNVNVMNAITTLSVTICSVFTSFIAIVLFDYFPNSAELNCTMMVIVLLINLLFVLKLDHPR